MYYNGDRERDWLRTPLVWNMSASSELTPFHSDFLPDYEEVNLPIRAVESIGQVFGRGTVLRRFTTRTGKKVYIGSWAYHMPASDLRLESPQSVSQGLGGGCWAKVDGYNVEWHMPDGDIIDIPIDPRSNLPLLHDFACTEAEKKEFGPAHAHQAASIHHEVKSTGASTRTSANSVKVKGRGTLPSKFDELSEEDKCLHGCVCTSAKENQNLSGAPEGATALA